MDLVRELKDVRFELSLRGYDCEAVDAFLAKLRGDITSVQEENERASARISELENAVQTGGGSSETEGTLRRTLVLAQRLADETEAEAKKDAAEMHEAAAAEAAQMRASAETESRSMREEGKRELDNARDEAASIRETVSEEAARLRAETRVESEKILAEAERRGMERVAELERAAQVEVATMREPIRAEVSELESARARVMEDISALESHLEQQRVRVRTAVEALRVGMSGSIEDLERVADDDELLATQPGPEISGAGAADVAVAPDIEIIDAVAERAPEAPSADDVEDTVRSGDVAEVAEAADITVEDAPENEESLDHAPAGAWAEDTAAEAWPEDTAVEGTLEDTAVEGTLEDTAVEGTLEDTAVEGTLEDTAVEEAEVVAESFDDHGPATEPIPVVDGSAPAEELVPLDEDDDDLVVELDGEPTALFGTEVSSDAEAVAVDDVEGAAAAGAAAVGSALIDGPSTAEPVDDGPKFVERFAELLDAHPVGREQ